jgi:hypothetical protein
LTYLLAIPWVLACEPLIPTLVVAGQARHQLLRVWACGIGRLAQEVLGVSPSKCCCNPGVMKDLDVTVLATSVAEAEVSGVVG